MSNHTREGIEIDGGGSRSGGGGGGGARLVGGGWKQTKNNNGAKREGETNFESSELAFSQCVHVWVDRWASVTHDT